MSVSTDRDRNIQVSGQTEFPEKQWRSSILHFLDGIWGDKEHITNRPIWACGGAGFRLDKVRCAYEFTGDDSERVPLEEIHFTETISTTHRQKDFELALIRFVKNGKIKLLEAESNEGIFYLWKKPRGYGIAFHPNEK